MRRLISAVIVVVVLGTAGGLAICAIPRIRENVARIQCQKNLGEIGLAILNSYDTYGTFTTATYPNENLPVARQLSWLVYINAFMEQQGIFSSFDCSKAWDDERNLRGEIPNRDERFRCPSYPHIPAPVGVSNYVGISGVEPDAAELQIGDPSAGFFGYERKIKLEDIKDGSANTLAVMETTSNLGLWTAGGFATVRPLDPAAAPYLGTGRTFGSGHRAVTLAVCADGSVHGLTNSIQPEVLEALATIAGGEKTELLGD